MRLAYKVSLIPEAAYRKEDYLSFKMLEISLYT